MCFGFLVLGKESILFSTQTDKNGKKTTFTWITNIKLSENRLNQLMRAARARWKIENETFNTLKNLGYHFEHNYGHGQDHLSTAFAYLMLIAFYIDQLIQACCHTFREIEKYITTKIKMWNTIKAIFKTIYCQSMNDILKPYIKFRIQRIRIFVEQYRSKMRRIRRIRIF